MAAFTTQKIAGTKSTITIPAWVLALQNSAGMVDDAASYAKVPLVYKAVTLRANSLASAPVRVLRGEKEVEWPFNTSLKKVLWMTEAAMLLSGAAYWLKRSNRVQVKDLQWLNPFAMEVQASDDYSLIFQQTMKDGKRFFQDEVMFFKEFHPTDDLITGVGAAQVALSGAKLSNFMMQFAVEFFKNGAMPVTLVTVPSGTPHEEVKRVQNFFQRMITGISNSHKVVAVQGDKDNGVGAQVISQPLSDLAMPELREAVLQEISHAFGIPKTMLLADAANFATAKEDRMGFWQETIRPRAEVWIESVINEQLLKERGLRMEFAFDEMDIFQQDEQVRAASYYNYIQAGMKPSIAAQILGVELPADYEYDMLDEDAKEVREVEAVEDDRRPRPVVTDELRAWLRFEEARFGKEDKREFECKFTPSALAGAIQGALETAKSKDDIRRIFRQAERWKDYP